MNSAAADNVVNRQRQTADGLDIFSQRLCCCMGNFVKLLRLKSLDDRINIKEKWDQLDEFLKIVQKKP